MRARAVFLAECLIVGGLLLLGCELPIPFAIAAILVLPAFVALMSAIAVPRLLIACRGLRYYAHSAVVLSTACLATVFVGYWNELAEPEIHLLPAGFTGQVVILYDVADGAEAKREQGRRVYEIPASGVLRSQFPANKRFYWPGRRQLFYRGPSGQRLSLASADASIAGLASGLATQEKCDVRYDAYIVTHEPTTEVAPAGADVLGYLRDHPVPCREPAG